MLVPISIHAPRTGSDPTSARRRRALRHFNPRSPHGERRYRALLESPGNNFNPRSPHGERRVTAAPYRRPRHFNPRSPHGERRRRSLLRRTNQYFNPRSPHGERQMSSPDHASSSIFQSTLPARGATRAEARQELDGAISIHAPRTGSDRISQRPFLLALYFNPRSPHGERHHQQTDTPPDS